MLRKTRDWNFRSTDGALRRCITHNLWLRLKTEVVDVSLRVPVVGGWFPRRELSQRSEAATDRSVFLLLQISSSVCRQGEPFWLSPLSLPQWDPSVLIEDDNALLVGNRAILLSLSLSLPSSRLFVSDSQLLTIPAKAWVLQLASCLSCHCELFMDLPVGAKNGTLIDQAMFAAGHCVVVYWIVWARFCSYTTLHPVIIFAN